MLDDSKEGVEETSQSLKNHIECYEIYPKDVFLLYPIAYITLGDDWAENISLLNKCTAPNRIDIAYQQFR